MENELVRYSRAGDVFHYRWAARRCLKMIHPKSPVKRISIEGASPAENETAGEYVIDVAEYTEDPDGNNLKITYFQLKHTTQRVYEPFTLSDLKDTIEGFAKRFSALIYENSSKYQLGSIRFVVITNRKIADSFKEGIFLIKQGSRTVKQFQETLEKYTQLNGIRLQEFCDSLDLIDGEGDYIAQRHELHSEISGLLAGFVDNNQIDSIIALVQDKALPKSNNEIVREDILKRFGINSERQLFPAPLEFEKSKNFIKREQHEDLLNSVVQGSTPLIIHAGGGVGKSVFSRQIVESLPSGSLGIVYDCFGAGKYRNRSESRHRHRDALVQIANEIALHGLCEILIPRPTDLDDEILRAFLSRLNIAATTLRKANKDAILIILIDAADNAEMAAKEFGESCFAHQLLYEQFPEGCRIVALCRTERINLLKPLSTVSQIELKPFSQAETMVHLKEYFSDATDIDGLEFHRLTASNPRVQANALSIHYNTVADILAALGPSVTTVGEQIAAQLASAISTVKDKLPLDFQGYIDAICLGLANLTPFIPINVLATAAKVDVSTVVSFVADLGRPLWISENSVQFRDEPTETWFREKFSASKQQIESYITCLKPLAFNFPYVAQVLPSLLLQSENYDELINLALSDDYLPEDSPIDERNIRFYRLQFAFKAALKKKRYTDAAKLALRAGEESAGDKRQLELLTQNVDLIAPLQSSQRVQELAFRQMLRRGNWHGSENVYSAALLSFVEEFKGEARVFLRAASNWLNLYFEEVKKNKNKADIEERLTEDDIVEMAVANFNLYGIRKLVDFILNWRPPEVVFRITRLFIKRLVDIGNFADIDEISRIGCRNQYLMIAIADELIAIGKFPPIDAMRQCLDLLIHKKIRIAKSSNYWREEKFVGSIISFAEASAALGLSQNKILRVLNYYFPQRAFASVNSDYNDRERYIFLRGTALRAKISGSKQPDIESLIPQRLLENKKKSQISQEIEEFKQVVGSLLPWYLIRSDTLLGKINDIETAFQEADQSSKKARQQRYRQNDNLPFEIARIRFESLVFKKPCDHFEEMSIIEKLSNNEYKFSFQDDLRAVRTAYRLEHLSQIRNQLEQSCYEKIVSVSNERPEETAENYILLARAVLVANPNDAAAYFNCAVEAVSKFGDELVERWNAITAMAKRSAEGGHSSPEIAYSFIRCAELVGDTVVREKYWNRNEAIQICTQLSPQSAFAALSRWRDRNVGWFENQVSTLAHEAVFSGIISPSVGWSLSTFSWVNRFNDWLHCRFEEFASLCIEKESNKACRQYILDTAVRDIRLSDASENIWYALKAVAKKFSLRNKEIDKVLTFHSQQLQTQIKNTEDSTLEYRITQSEGGQNIDWDVILADLDLAQATELNTALNRFEALNCPVYYQIFWEEVIKKVSISKASDFLTALLYAEKADLYHIKYALSIFPDNYRQKISIKKSWNQILILIGKRFASELASYYSHEKFIKEIRADISALTSIYEGILKGLSDSCNLVDASTFFGFTKIISSFISPQEASEILKFALFRFEIHIDKDYGDGTWHSRLMPPENITEAFTGFVWAALGSPRSSVRWQAAHCVRRLAETGCESEIDALVKWMNQDCVNAFGSSVFPFYNLHARLYLLIALARVAIENPEKVKRHHSIFAYYALDSLPHALIQKFAAEIALSIEVAFSGTYDNSVLEKLQQVGVSQMPIKRIDGYKESFEETPWHIRGEIDRNLKLYFGWDFDRYWFEPLGRLFGISTNQVQELAREVVFNEWGLAIDDNFISDPRSSLWTSYANERETLHSHGSYPLTDDYSFYISYHTMFNVAAKLLLEMPVIHRDNWYEDKWADWLQRHTLTRFDGRWLADRRDPAPLKRRTWVLQKDKKTENWRQNLQDDDFLDSLLTQKNGETWLNIFGSWADSDYKHEEDIYITSALVSQATSQSLLNALSSCLNPYDFKIPAYQEESMEFNESPFELQGWILRELEREGIDSADPHAGKINYPPYKVGNSIAEQLGLTVDLEQRNWYISSINKKSLVCELWKLPEQVNKEDPYRYGNRMVASLEFLKLLCSNLKCELIFEVKIKRDFHKSLDYGEREDDKEYSLPNSKIYILSADGKLRNTRTCYQLR